MRLSDLELAAKFVKGKPNLTAIVVPGSSVKQVAEKLGLSSWMRALNGVIQDVPCV